MRAGEYVHYHKLRNRVRNSMSDVDLLDDFKRIILVSHLLLREDDSTRMSSVLDEDLDVSMGVAMCVYLYRAFSCDVIMHLSMVCPTTPYLGFSSCL